MYLEDGIEIQIMKLAEQGLGPEEIAGAFTNASLTPEAVALIIRTNSGQKRLTADELMEQYRLDAIKFLGGVLHDEEAPAMAKVRAAEILVARKGAMSVGEQDEVVEMFKRSQELKKKNDNKVVKLPEQSKAA